MESNICCMFNDPVPGHAVSNSDLDLLASDIWSRKEYKIYRCRRCGNYVLYSYEENNGFDWDDPGINEYYIPIVEPEIQDGEYPEDITYIEGAPRLCSLHKESDYLRGIYWEKCN